MSAYEVHESSSSANQDVVKIFYGNKVLLISQEILDRPTGQRPSILLSIVIDIITIGDVFLYAFLLNIIIVPPNTVFDCLTQKLYILNAS